MNESICLQLCDFALNLKVESSWPIWNLLHTYINYPNGCNNDNNTHTPFPPEIPPLPLPLPPPPARGLAGPSGPRPWVRLRPETPPKRQRLITTSVYLFMLWVVRFKSAAFLTLLWGSLSITCSGWSHEHEKNNKISGTYGCLVTFAWIVFPTPWPTWMMMIVSQNMAWLSGMLNKFKTSLTGKWHHISISAASFRPFQSL